MIARDDIQDIRRAILATVVVSMVAWVLGHILGHDIPTSNRDAVMVVLGVLLQRFTDIIGFDFNTNSASAKKDQTIGALADTAKAAGAALAPLAGTEAITIKPGEQATVAANPEGDTVIDKQPHP